jgi:hypothetical protein
VFLVKCAVLESSRLLVSLLMLGGRIYIAKALSFVGMERMAQSLPSMGREAFPFATPSRSGCTLVSYWVLCAISDDDVEGPREGPTGPFPGVRRLRSTIHVCNDVW